ncbi:MAG TPA: DUF971 domain-containing protein [Candidatus Micrarchaeia archaeon]|nr:DUF971 domain-containing protein [Candidatus Micrarchaeia archaeon]
MVPPAELARPTPSAFAYDERALALVVTWADGPVHRIRFADLRRACPCAVCKGEMGRPGRFDQEPSLRPGEDDLVTIELVGQYAVGAEWRDGHRTGIYSFERLRQLGDRLSTGS